MELLPCQSKTCASCTTSSLQYTQLVYRADEGNTPWPWRIHPSPSPIGPLALQVARETQRTQTIYLVKLLRALRMHLQRLSLARQLMLPVHLHHHCSADNPIHSRVLLCLVGAQAPTKAPHSLAQERKKTKALPCLAEVQILSKVLPSLVVVAQVQLREIIQGQAINLRASILARTNLNYQPQRQIRPRICSAK